MMAYYRKYYRRRRSYYGRRRYYRGRRCADGTQKVKGLTRKCLPKAEAEAYRGAMKYMRQQIQHDHGKKCGNCAGGVQASPAGAAPAMVGNSQQVNNVARFLNGTPAQVPAIGNAPQVETPGSGT